MVSEVEFIVRNKDLEAKDDALRHAFANANQVLRNIEHTATDAQQLEEQEADHVAYDQMSRLENTSEYLNHEAANFLLRDVAEAQGNQGKLTDRV